MLAHIIQNRREEFWMYKEVVASSGIDKQFKIWKSHLSNSES